MAERSSKRKKREHDFAVTAFRVVQEAVGEEHEAKAEQVDSTPEQRHDAAVILGRRGGKKGGPARANKLDKERRREIARNAAKARWARRNKGN